MAKKPKLGKKHVCANCGTKYYDLERDPIICPSCGTKFEPVEVKVRPKAAKLPVVAPAAKEEAPKGPETVSLEDADAEATKTGAVKADSDDDEIDDIETIDGEGDDVAKADDSDTFLPTDDDDDDDVGSMIGDVKKDDS